MLVTPDIRTRTSARSNRRQPQPREGHGQIRRWPMTLGLGGTPSVRFVRLNTPDPPHHHGTENTRRQLGRTHKPGAVITSTSVPVRRGPVPSGKSAAQGFKAVRRNIGLFSLERSQSQKGGGREVLAQKPGRRRFQVVLIKPSHYDDDGYVIQWLRSAIPSNSLAVRLRPRRRTAPSGEVLGPDVEIDDHAVRRDQHAHPSE